MLMIQAICVLRVADLLSWESSPYDYGTARLWHNLRVVCLVASLGSLASYMKEHLPNY